MKGLKKCLAALIFLLLIIPACFAAIHYEANINAYGGLSFSKPMSSYLEGAGKSVWYTGQFKVDLDLAAIKTGSFNIGFGAYFGRCTKSQSQGTYLLMDYSSGGAGIFADCRVTDLLSLGLRARLYTGRFSPFKTYFGAWDLEPYAGLRIASKKHIETSIILPVTFTFRKDMIQTTASIGLRLSFTTENSEVN